MAKVVVIELVIRLLHATCYMVVDTCYKSQITDGYIEPVWSEGPILPSCLQDILADVTEDDASDDELGDDDASDDELGDDDASDDERKVQVPW